MSDAVVYSELQDRILMLSNTLSNTRYTAAPGPALVMAFINKSITSLDDRITEKVQDFRLASSSLSVALGDTVTALPLTFYKLRNIYTTVDGIRYRILPFKLQEDSALYNQGLAFSGETNFHYTLFGDNIRWSPAADKAYTVVIDYVRKSPSYAATSDTVDFINGWDRYVQYDVAALILEMEGLDSSAFRSRAMQEMQGILGAATARNQADPDHVVYYADDIYYYLPRA